MSTHCLIVAEASCAARAAPWIKRVLHFCVDARKKVAVALIEPETVSMFGLVEGRKTHTASSIRVQDGVIFEPVDVPIDAFSFRTVEIDFVNKVAKSLETATHSEGCILLLEPLRCLLKQLSRQLVGAETVQTLAFLAADEPHPQDPLALELVRAAGCKFQINFVPMCPDPPSLFHDLARTTGGVVVPCSSPSQCRLVCKALSLTIAPRWSEQTEPNRAVVRAWSNPAQFLGMHWVGSSAPALQWLQQQDEPSGLSGALEMVEFDADMGKMRQGFHANYECRWNAGSSDLAAVVENTGEIVNACLLLDQNASRPASSRRALPLVEGAELGSPYALYLVSRLLEAWGGKAVEACLKVPAELIAPCLRTLVLLGEECGPLAYVQIDRAELAKRRALAIESWKSQEQKRLYRAHRLGLDMQAVAHAESSHADHAESSHADHAESSHADHAESSHADHAESASHSPSSGAGTEAREDLTLEPTAQEQEAKRAECKAKRAQVKTAFEKLDRLVRFINKSAILIPPAPIYPPGEVPEQLALEYTRKRTVARAALAKQQEWLRKEHLRRLHVLNELEAEGKARDEEESGLFWDDSVQYPGRDRIEQSVVAEEDIDLETLEKELVGTEEAIEEPYRRFVQSQAKTAKPSVSLAQAKASPAKQDKKMTREQQRFARQEAKRLGISVQEYTKRLQEARGDNFDETRMTDKEVQEMQSIQVKVPWNLPISYDGLLLPQGRKPSTEGTEPLQLPELSAVWHRRVQALREHLVELLSDSPFDWSRALECGSES